MSRPLSATRLAMLTILLASVAYGAYFAWFAIARHNAQMTHTADLGQMDLAIWNTSQGRFVQEVKGDSISTRLTDHVEPVFWPLSVLLGAWDDVRTLLAAQALAMALAAVPVAAFVMARRRTLPRPARPCPFGDAAWLALAASWAGLAYLLAPQGQAALLADLHAVPFASLPLALLLYLGHRRQALPALVVAVLALAVKEEIALLVAGTGIYLALARRWRFGWLVALLAVAWFVVATFAIIPQYSRPAYGSAQSPYLARYENGSGERGGPLALAASLAAPDRLRYYVGLLVAFAGMPLLAPELAIVAAPLIAANAASNYPAMYSGEFHYSAPFLSLLACAAGVGASRWLRFAWRGGRVVRLLALAPLVALPIGYQVAEGYTPLGAEHRLNLRPVTEHQRLLGRFASQIPAGAALSTTPALHPHFSHRERIYTFPSHGDAEYVLLDVSGTTDMHPADVRSAFDSLLRSGFGVADSADGYVLLSTGTPGGGLSPEFLDFARPDTPPRHRLDASFGTSLRLLGYDWLDDPKWGLTRLRLHWQALGPLGGDLTPHVVLADADGTVVADSRQAPFVETYWHPLSEWQTGETVTTTTVGVELGAAFEAYVGIVVGGDHSDPAARLPITLVGGEARVAESLRLLRLSPLERGSRFSPGLRPMRQAAVPQGFTASQATFGGVLSLESFQHAERVAAGQTLAVRSRWRRTGDLPGETALSFAPGDFAVSLRLLDSAGQVVAQADGPLHGGLYPPVDWPLDEVVGDSRSLLVPADLAPAEYELALLVYSRETLAPLAVAGAPYLIVGSVQVEAGQ